MRYALNVKGEMLNVNSVIETSINANKHLYIVICNTYPVSVNFSVNPFDASLTIVLPLFVICYSNFVR